MTPKTTEEAASVMTAAAGVSSTVDLRSDTVTKPTPEMRRAMADAEVGDDVFGEDPTVNRLQTRAAQIFEREAALFVPSGSMGNLISILCSTRPGNEVICEERGHICQFEMASMSAIAGCMPRTTRVEDGILTWDLVEALIRPKTYMRPQTVLVALENTHNMAGGTVYPQEVSDEICDKAHAAGMRVHLDGARIFNAAVALGKSVAQLTAKFDTVQFCLSKGLGAPVGSMVVGTKETIEKARSYRKMLGGGMRQAGVLAAAGLLALERSPSRLHIDHENARCLAEQLSELRGVKIDLKSVQTNIVMVDVHGTGKTAADICRALAAKKILCLATGSHEIRMVTHCDVDRAGIERGIEAFSSVLKN
ncbi:MAG TPA: GntG family PLP-dependent aldolase [Candidatus Acidoferrales bacterium]|nr:GntG family PLP-dependent aldolase [Candidatus Acidoferrales bacterium]